jgi:hypothetical protein
MKKLFLALIVLGSAIDTSLTAPPTRTIEITTGMMNIGIITITGIGTASEATGVTRITSMNSSQLARIGAAFEPGLRTKESLLTRNMWLRFGAMQRAAKALGQFIPA